MRTYSYAVGAGVEWLRNCDACENLPVDGPWLSPFHDPAPWYSATDYNYGGFYGFYGMEVTGDSTSTRTAKVTNTIDIGGVIGPAYFGPRTLLFRLVAVAQNDCSLEYG